jgi:hypothetical protein
LWWRGDGGSLSVGVAPKVLSEVRRLVFVCASA